MGNHPVGNQRRALLSVTDKTRLDEIGKLLHSYGYELIASGGTARYLRDKDIPVTGINELTGYPEIFGGRVKTLHPVIHGGILGPSRESFAETVELGINPIDVVVVNLYQFREAVAAGAGEAETVEKIDIGGPTLMRAAAKNFGRVTVVSDPAQYDEFIAELNTGKGETSLDFRRRMAASTFRMIEQYNDAIASYFEGSAGIPLRYGENPHQEATLHLPAAPAGQAPLTGIGLTQHGGKELSYNNIVDLVAAVKLVGDFDQPCCGILKHTNPCGFGLGEGLTGLERALKCDPVSAFGGVFAFNTTVDLGTANVLAKRFLEIIIAPNFTSDALARLTKKKNVRVLTMDMEKFLAGTRGRTRSWGRLVLTQGEDDGFPELEEWKVAAGEEPDDATRTALEMVWKVCKHGKSNAIVLGDMTATLGMGFGQMSRVDSTELAVLKAGNQGLDLLGCVAGSDGFFPFPDGIEKLAAAGARAVIAPGGSIRDDEVAEAAEKLGVTLILTNRRHFNH
ncbi:MAG: bifunctional phosphoribosylaminoimidazolecarboxamide formyltransferase/IMP cyclohydrolase [Candidatus Krumholzibacteria bacterium]|nr:bifunctional phosphoribosylaminoimidazolecarboxamide formyltransferase/IMP cyclohydrolase [Candidatus Krumholzibacteria bacterium]